ncbi:ribosomal S14p/S29e family protein [Orientia chuto str. Dubai]|uniref:Small ribosomal subunit protein uS14 n=1 Tax=Orientia chuto str. Dubai TaxID=1359168 RepID=A0A0F3ML02_9RICK|nr:30S ribosomal protein S14 [Candidatus Orientia mediorientalis]KJV55269.1 ribosomal S14p/S29e family protein [Orientia chuto str. Dubai]
MAKVSAIQRNIKRSKLFNKLKLKRQRLKSEIYNKNLSLEERFNLVLKLSNLPRNSSITRIRNRCAETGRPRGYYNQFGLCRNVIRKLAGSGIIPGLRKSSW